jgi:hypothetical protein
VTAVTTLIAVIAGISAGPAVNAVTTPNAIVMRDDPRVAE